jgi:hypothetical protein
MIGLDPGRPQQRQCARPVLIYDPAHGTRTIISETTPRARAGSTARSIVVGVDLRSSPIRAARTRVRRQQSRTPGRRACRAWLVRRQLGRIRPVARSRP